MYMLQLAKEHHADSRAAAERGRLVHAVRQAASAPRRGPVDHHCSP